jgi:hypothetical protein
MVFPPTWKIKRELFAGFDQIKAWSLYLLSPIRGYYYDRSELSEIKIHDGDRNLRGKLILYLIFQPKGLKDSSVFAIQYLVSQGHEVLLISNGLISLGDINKIKPLCWKIIERKNIGYDFGGYRCGLHYLRKNNIDLEEITLINDSIWFPVISGGGFLEKTEGIVSDFGGAVCLADTKNNNKNLVLSYWLTVRQSLFKSSQFWSYWRQYIPSSNKILTVRLGERGLSRYMHLAGRDVDGVFTTENFINAVKMVGTDQLKLILKYGSFTDDIFESECNKLLRSFEETDQWRSSSLDFIERVVRRRNFLHSFCYASIAVLQVPFLKKNNLRLQVLMRQKYLQAVYAGDLSTPHPSILKEIEEGTEFQIT